MKTTFFVLAMTLLIGNSAFADDTKSQHGKMPMKELTKEQRSKMADMHEKMAACLRSDKAMSECHKEMMDACKAVGEACPMGHMGGMHNKGMMHHESNQ